ncbi:AraC family transcriptional regulator [Vibrio jasicida]|uniref:AraC family transcriptional regulator n=1 Tax=Vibrio jasicida TaxID=766224 RepID=A0AAU9QSC4_9VIBR|nr:AraC family transcriptional regulator [Vibrio jasicida]CAH1600673.1 AraC family transcriptional regulator [Vibrio jasicida]
MTVVFEGVPLVRSEWVHYLAELYKRSDVDVHQLIKVTQAPEDIQITDVEFLPETTLKNLILAFGKSCSPETFIYTILGMCRDLYVPKILEQLSLTPSMTVAEGIEEFCRVIPLFSNNTRIGLERYHNHLWFARYKDGDAESWYQYAELFSVIFMDELVDALSNSKQKTLNVSLKCAGVAPFFNCSQLQHIQFYTNRAATGIQLDDGILSQTVCMPSKRQSVVKAPLSEIPTSFLPSFRLAIQPYTSVGRLSILDASRILGINKRTLQRRLCMAGVTYSDVIEELLLERSLRLLKDSHLSITTIASSLGYTDTANFTRFIPRKMGVTPSAYRKASSFLTS